MILILILDASDREKSSGWGTGKSGVSWNTMYF